MFLEGSDFSSCSWWFSFLKKISRKKSKNLLQNDEKTCSGERAKNTCRNVLLVIIICSFSDIVKQDLDIKAYNP